MPVANRDLLCQGLSKSFGGIRALDRVTIGVRAGTTAALVGPNGSGKTTLLNVVTGLLKPDSGSAWLGKEDLSARGPWRIARLGVMRTFQEVRIVGKLTVHENMLLAAEPRRRQVRKSVVETTLETVGLWDMHNKPAGALSYGQQKLLTLAYCMASGARTILLDEPVAGLSPPAVEKTAALLGEWRHEDITVLFVEHDLSFVKRIATSVFVMNTGKVVGEGHPSEVLEKDRILKVFLG